MSTNFHFKKTLLAVAVSSIAIAAHAQDSDERAIEELTFIGSNLSRARVLEQKQNDDRIIEALGTDELGQFPGRNVGESLNRLPGD